MLQDMEVDGENFVLLGDVELKELLPIIGHRAKIRHLRDSAVSIILLDRHGQSPTVKSVPLICLKC